MNHLILFGYPGAGKSYIGSLLHDEYGFEFIEGDNYLPQSMLTALNTSTPITDAMRDEFMEILCEEYSNALQHHDLVVLSQTFLQDRHRQTFHTRFPEARFILITAPDPMREIRYMERKSLSFDVSYLRTMVSLFEPITISYHQIENPSDGSEEIIKQLTSMGLEKKR